MLHNGHYLDHKSTVSLSEALTKHYMSNPAFTELVMIGIGTNRNSGDSLGPMVGSRMSEQLGGRDRIHIYGTLEKPVHALNMQRTLAHINEKHSRAYIIAIDACLGRFYKVGTLQLVEEPLIPGASLGKQLPPIGHIHLKGIVNNFGPDLNHKILEHTSLTFVREMAAVISRILVKSSQDIVPRFIQERNADDQPEDLISSGT